MKKAFLILMNFLLIFCLVGCTMPTEDDTYTIVVKNGTFTDDNSNYKNVEYKTILTVIPDVKEGYEFIGWYEGDKLLSTKNEYSFLVEKSMDIEAKFNNSLIIKNGWYCLTSKYEEGMNITKNYVFNSIKITDNQATWYEVDINGANESSGTVEIINNQLTIKIGLKVYKFDVSKDLDQLSFDGSINRIGTKMTYKYVDNYSKPNDTGSVNFTDELFGDDINQNFYNYCPSIMIENGNTMHIWYCSNKESGKVTDYVAYRKGVLSSDGKWTFTEKEFVLSPSDTGWDSVHVCDPKVIKGEFKYNNETYNYMMAYLGCETTNCTINEVGLAVAKNPNGPYIKLDNINPIANFNKAISDHGNANNWKNSWGYGQPSLINLDKKGNIMLFYSVGCPTSTHTACEKWDLSDLNNPVCQGRNVLSTIGVTNASGVSDCINNADFAYDPIANRLYCIKEDFPYPTDNEMNWVAGGNTLMYLNLNENEKMDSIINSNTQQWICFDKITKQSTGFERNHNMGLVTDEYGWVTSESKLSIVYTMSKLPIDYPNWEAKGQWPALHTYRLHGFTVDMPR